MSAGTVSELLELLRARKVSRNRNFDLFQSPAARRALRLHLLLQHLERVIMASADRDSVRVRIDGRDQRSGTRVLEIEDQDLRLHRRVYLTEEELSMLLRVPAIADLLPREAEEA